MLSLPISIAHTLRRPAASTYRHRKQSISSCADSAAAARVSTLTRVALRRCSSPAKTRRLRVAAAAAADALATTMIAARAWRPRRCRRRRAPPQRAQRNADARRMPASKRRTRKRRARQHARACAPANKRPTRLSAREQRRSSATRLVKLIAGENAPTSCTPEN